MLGLGVALAPRLSAEAAAAPPPGVAISGLRPDEDLFGYLERTRGAFAEDLYKGLLGAANEFKEGDAAQGIHAADEASRR